MSRTILVHLNITVPDSFPDNIADELRAEVRGALEVGTDSDQTPWLAEAFEVDAVAAEEI